MSCIHDPNHSKSNNLFFPSYRIKVKSNPVSLDSHIFTYKKQVLFQYKNTGTQLMEIELF